MLRPYMTGLVFWRLFSANPDLREGGGARRGGAVVGVELEGSGRSALAQSGRRENGPIKLTDMAFLRLRPCPGRGFTPGCVLVATSEGGEGRLGKCVLFTAPWWHPKTNITQYCFYQYCTVLLAKLCQHKLTTRAEQRDVIEICSCVFFFFQLLMSFTTEILENPQKNSWL